MLFNGRKLAGQKIYVYEKKTGGCLVYIVIGIYP